MSLINDPDYLIHKLRLAYLRHVDDQQGSKLISFSSRYTSNPHVLAAGLADSERWPELLVPSSPPPSDEEAEKDKSASRTGRRRNRASQGATGLKYSETIMGPSRTGLFGMRVSGKRASTLREAPLPPLPTETLQHRTRADSEPTPMPTTNGLLNGDGHGEKPVGSPGAKDDPLIQVGDRRSAGGSSFAEAAQIHILAEDKEKEDEESTPNPNAANAEDAKATVTALPSLTRIAEIQARRMRRRAHFSSAANGAPGPVLLANASTEDSSDEEGADESGVELEDGDSDFADEAVEGEDFDPDFAPPHIGVNSDSAASASNSIMSTSNSSAYDHTLHNMRRGQTRRRGRPNGRRISLDDNESSDSTTQPRSSESNVDSYFEIVQPVPTGDGPADAGARSSNETSRTQKQLVKTDELTFTKRPIAPLRPTASALTQKLASSDASSNPFTELYALISGRSEASTASTTVTVFFPHATRPQGEAMRLSVRKDASVEEVIGFALWSYWEEGWEPELDEGLGGEEDPRRKIRLSAAGWVLRIAEDDGEVDGDFPAPDRMAKISLFGIIFAILEATPAQIAQNQQLESKIVRRPSRIIVAKKPESSLALPPAPTVTPMSVFGSVMPTSFGLPTSMSNISSSLGPQILLKIRVADMKDTAVHYSTTISVSSAMYMQDVLELVCRKRKLPTSKDWALLSSDCKTLVLLDRTVASLESNLELVLVQREALPQYGYPIDGDRRGVRTTDPNASIFKRISEVPSKAKGTEMDFIAAYKKYTVFRKVPVMVGRLERTLAIDGDYIHIMPSAHKARGVFDSGKTVSYHIKSVANCLQSGKSSSAFKLVVRRDGGEKRYDFEAEDPKTASEIVSIVKGMKGLERSSTMKTARRSRHVVG